MNSKPIVLVALLLLMAFYSCKKEQPQNKLPTCYIINPANGDGIEQGITITISAFADDDDGSITEVCFFIDEYEIGTSNSYPYKCNYNTTNLELGSHTIKVIAKDNSSSSNSNTIEIIIIEGDSNTGTVTDYDGNIYKVVVIGNQKWMGEDLKVTHYPNGDAIPLVTDNYTWAHLEDNNADDAYCYYNNEKTDKYGALYTFAAALGNNGISSGTNPSGVQGVCPDEWHLPSRGEWIDLLTYIENIDLYTALYLKAENGWSEGGNGFDIFGFKALPGGYRYCSNGIFFFSGRYGCWWSSSENGDINAYYNYMSFNSGSVSSNYGKKSLGYSVRCVKNN